MRTVLIANRGEIACRIIKSCRALGIKSVAVYSDADAEALHVQLADEVHYIGPAKPRESYLHFGRLLEAAKLSGAEAVHPGYGFLAENADFAETVQSAGLIWVGPNPAVIRKMGDKERARKIAKCVGVPVLPGSGRFTADSMQNLAATANRIGFPLLIKAAAGGGGIGMRLAENAEQAEKVAAATQELAKRAFGDDAIFLERFVRVARHVEVQIFGFGDGRAVHYFERDCSIQRRFQKIIEESPAPNLSGEIRQSLAEAALALATRENYASAGTVEFVVDGETGDFFFLEMNTRIQVEHPVTEETTGVDLVALQLRLAAGDDLSEISQPDIRQNGHAIECRVYAENPSRMFLPTPGKLETLKFPKAADGLRIDSGVSEGDSVTPHYDPMIAKIIAHGKNRQAAVSRMQTALAESQVEGTASNLAFLRRCLSNPDFCAGKISTDFVDRHKASLIE